MSSQDLELGQVPAPTPIARSALPPCKGFIAVASKIASDPDKSTTIYRRFDNLSTRNILYYQAELAELEDLQKRYDEEDQNARDESSIECQRDWEAFVLCAQDEGREKRKMDLIMKIRTTLEKYRKIFLLYPLQYPSHSVQSLGSIFIIPFISLSKLNS